MKRRLLVFLLACAITAALGYSWYSFVASRQNTKSEGATQEKTSSGNLTKSVKNDAEPKFDSTKYSLTDPASIWLVVNKTRPLQPKTYVPADLVVPQIQLRSNISGDERQTRQMTADALRLLSEAAKKDGLTLTLESGYRSYQFQANLYGRYVREQGQAVADTQSARAGYSEHQTGLAADIGGTSQPGCNVAECYGGTAEGKWVAANAYKYGFIIRYLEGKKAVTGYIYEPWHLRYVGTDLAAEMRTKGIQTLEEFFNLPPAPDYN